MDSGENIGALIERLGSDPEAGLGEGDALERASKYGKNILAPKKEMKEWGVLAFLKEPMVWLLAIAGAVYWWLGDIAEAVITLVAIIPIAVLDVAIELQTDRALEKLKKLGEPEATVVRGGAEKRIRTEELVPGDIVLLREGDVVMADCAIISGSDIRADESSLTGESLPVEKKAGEYAGGELFANKGMLFAGTTVVSGRARCIVVETGQRTSYGKIGGMLAATEEGKTPLQAEIERIITNFGIAAVALSVALIAIEMLTSGPVNSETWKHAVISGVSLAIAAIPEEFPVVFTLFLSLGMLALANRNSLVRKLSAVEALGSVDVICTDKTGTITSGKMALSSLVPDMGVDEGEFMLAALMACEKEPFDYMEKAVYEKAYGSRALDELEKWELVQEYPFDREDKYMSHVWKGKGLVLCAKGSVEGILKRCGMGKTEKQRALRANEEMAKKGMRVLALARKELDRVRGRKSDESGMEFLGLMGFSDPLRKGIPEAMRECQEAGIRVIMLTGDHMHTADAIAHQAGIAHTGIMEGRGLEVPESRFLQILRQVNIFTRVLPEQKLRIVEGLQKLGYRVAVTGDGINDAPALKKANIGVAMGERGTEVAKEAADLVLLDDNFRTIVEAVRNGRKIFDNLRKAFAYLVVFHVPIFLSALLIPLMGLPLLLLPVHIVFLELVLHPVISVVFEKEPAEADVMRRRPRKKDQGILTRGEVLGLVLEGTVLSALALGAYVLSLGSGELHARGFALAVMISGQVFLMASKLSGKRTGVQSILSNSYLLPTAAIALAAYGLLMYVPFAAEQMSIAQLGIADWSFAWALALVPFAFSEYRKGK
ncbi:putative copper-exporting P-type ATPase A [uncultured archaeon]|nr:putative copper-exporting P-type ATPase A [uncultured archaeon]